MSGRRRPARRARRSSGRSRPDNPASDARRARPAVQGIRLPGRIFFGGDRGPLGRADCGPRTRLRRVFVRRLRRFLPCGELVPRPRLHLPGKRAHPHDARASPRARRKAAYSRTGQRAAWPQHLLRLRPGTQDRGHARFRALMELWIISVVLIAALAALLVAGVWIALTLLGVGWVAMVMFTHSP